MPVLVQDLACSLLNLQGQRFFPLPTSHLMIDREDFISSQGKSWRWAGKLPARRVGLSPVIRRAISVRVGLIGLDYSCHFCLATGIWEVSHTCGHTCRVTWLPLCLKTLGIILFCRKQVLKEKKYLPAWAVEELNDKIKSHHPDLPVSFHLLISSIFWHQSWEQLAVELMLHYALEQGILPFLCCLCFEDS